MSTTSYVCVMPHDFTPLLLYVAFAGLNLGMLLVRFAQWANAQLQKRKAWRQRRADEEAALALAEQQALMEAEADERMTCPVCWENRHPGMHYLFPETRLCREHSNQLQERVFTVEGIQHSLEEEIDKAARRIYA